MPINQLQREAFLKSEEFVDQVNGIVTQEAMYKAQTWTNADGALYQNLARIAKYPQEYGFPQTIISDTAWNTGFDEWAAAPDTFKAAIGTAVNTWWMFCTGIPNVAPPPPE
jgi:hypothetical protein